MFKLLNRLLSIFITDKHFPFFIFLFFVFINTYLSSLQLQTNLYTIPWVLFNFLPTLFSPIYIPFLLKPPDTTQYLYHTFSYDYFLCTPSPPFIYIYSYYCIILYYKSYRKNNPTYLPPLLYFQLPIPLSIFTFFFMFTIIFLHTEGYLFSYNPLYSHLLVFRTYSAFNHLSCELPYRFFLYSSFSIFTLNLLSSLQLQTYLPPYSLHVYYTPIYIGCFSISSFLQQTFLI